MRIIFKENLYIFFILISLIVGMKTKMEYGSGRRYQIQHTKDHGIERFVDQARGASYADAII
jgi:hypothetical protein